MDKIERIAKVCHEVNRAYCFATGEQRPPSWEQAPVWQVESCKNGVMAKLENNLSPEQQHQNWMKYKAEEGWRYGPKKDEVLKTHPCMVPYDELPQQQKVKDHLFGAVVGALKDL